MMPGFSGHNKNNMTARMAVGIKSYRSPVTNPTRKGMLLRAHACLDKEKMPPFPLTLGFNR